MGVHTFFHKKTIFMHLAFSSKSILLFNANLISNHPAFLLVVFISTAYLAPTESIAQASKQREIKVSVADVTYEAESASLTGNAMKTEATGLSGDSKVGNIHENAAITFSSTVDDEGLYNMVVTYCSGDNTRSLAVSVNDGPAENQRTPSTGGWNLPGTIKYQVRLNAGVNVIKLFSDAGGYCPDIDKISISRKSADELKLPFGANHEIVYDASTLEYDVFFNGSRIISDASAAVKNGPAMLKSPDYKSISHDVATINDDFGDGEQHTITLSAPGLPEMKQVFFTYPSRNYFLLEVEISGDNLSSNYMAPLSSATANILETGDNRALFVPFDNDAWITYDAKSMNSTMSSISSEVSAIYENNSRIGLILGSVEQGVWKTGIKTVGAACNLTELCVWGGFADKLVTRDEKVHGSISGSSLKSPKIFVGYYDDFRTGLEEYAKSVAIASPRYIYSWTKGTPLGWNSWGVIQSKISLENSKSVADYFANQIPEFRSDTTAYIDLDSYWENLTIGGVTGDFGPLTEFANHCKSKGLQPGIYWAPFVDWYKTARPVENSNYNYSDLWMKANGSYHDLDDCRALDPTHPGTQARIAYLIAKFKKCGFTMIKIDFIGHAAIEADGYYDPNVKTGMQAFRQGMQFLVDQLDGQMLVSVAISPNLASGPYAHIRRIACDAMSSIENTKNTLNSTSYGWWQSHIYNFVDADHIVFGNETEGVNRARFTSGLVTGTLTLGDDFSTIGPWTERIQKLVRNSELLEICRGKTAFLPYDANTGKDASEVFVRRDDNATYLAIVNYGENTADYAIDLGRAGLDPSTSYDVRELYSSELSSSVVDTLRVTVPASDSKIFKILGNR